MEYKLQLNLVTCILKCKEPTYLKTVKEINIVKAVVSIKQQNNNREV